MRGVVNLAGTIDMTHNIPGLESECGDTVVTALLGGTPATVPERYADVSANTMLPLGVPQALIWGPHDEFVPLPLAEKHTHAATRAGDAVRLIVVPDVGHFEIASPLSSAWPVVRSAIHSLLDGRVPR